MARKASGVYPRRLGNAAVMNVKNISQQTQKKRDFFGGMTTSDEKICYLKLCSKS